MTHRGIPVSRTPVAYGMPRFHLLTFSHGADPRERHCTMQNLGYYNGNIAPLDELTVPFNDRVNYFGDGVYEATMAQREETGMDAADALGEISSGLSKRGGFRL